MTARPGGYASKAEQAERLSTLRELWTAGVKLDAIGERLRLSTSTVSNMARRAGLAPRIVRGPKDS